MELASALFSSAASSLAAAQKGSLSSWYTVDPAAPPLRVGVWKVHRAKHNSNGKLVSIWSADKGSLLNGAGGASAPSRRGGGTRDRERDADRLKTAVDVLKKEVSTGSLLRTAAPEC